MIQPRLTRASLLILVLIAVVALLPNLGLAQAFDIEYGPFESTVRPYVDGGFARADSIFRAIWGMGDSGTNSAMHYLALTAGLVGMLIILLRPSSQNFATIGSWVLILLITVIGPIGGSNSSFNGSFFFQPVKPMLTNNGRDGGMELGESVTAFTPQLITIHALGSLHYAIFDAIFKCDKEDVTNSCEALPFTKRIQLAQDFASVSEAVIARHPAITYQVDIYKQLGCGEAVDLASPTYPRDGGWNSFTFRDVKQIIDERTFKDKYSNVSPAPFAILEPSSSTYSSYPRAEELIVEQAKATSIDFLSNPDGKLQKVFAYYLSGPVTLDNINASQSHKLRTELSGSVFNNGGSSAYGFKSSELQQLFSETQEQLGILDDEAVLKMPVSLGMSVSKLPSNQSLSPSSVGSNKAQLNPGATLFQEGFKAYKVSNCAGFHNQLRTDLLTNALVNNLKFDSGRVENLLSSVSTSSISDLGAPKNVGSDEIEAAQNTFLLYAKELEKQMSPEEAKNVMLASIIDYTGQVNPSQLEPSAGEKNKSIVNNHIKAQREQLHISTIGGWLGSISSDIMAVAITIAANFIGPLSVVYLDFLWTTTDMALMAILIVTPLMFLLGVLIPGNAIGVMITSIVAVLVIRTIPITFTVVDALLEILNQSFTSVMSIHAGDDRTMWETIGAKGIGAIFGGGDERVYEGAMMVFVASGLYTSMVAITMFLLFKVGDYKSNIASLQKLDQVNNEIGKMGSTIAKAIGITGTAVGLGAVGGLVGGAIGTKGGILARAGGALKGGAREGLEVITKSAPQIPVVSEVFKEANPLHSGKDAMRKSKLENASASIFDGKKKSWRQMQELLKADKEGAEDEKMLNLLRASDHGAFEVDGKALGDYDREAAIKDGVKSKSFMRAKRTLGHASFIGMYSAKDDTGRDRKIDMPMDDLFGEIAKRLEKYDPSTKAPLSVEAAAYKTDQLMTAMHQEAHAKGAKAYTNLQVGELQTEGKNKGKVRYSYQLNSDLESTQEIMKIMEHFDKSKDLRDKTGIKQFTKSDGARETALFTPASKPASNEKDGDKGTGGGVGSSSAGSGGGDAGIDEDRLANKMAAAMNKAQKPVDAGKAIEEAMAKAAPVIAEAVSNAVTKSLDDVLKHTKEKDKDEE